MLMVSRDQSSDLVAAIQLFTSLHPSTHTPTTTDMQSLRLIASYVTRRASYLLAAGVHALWSLHISSESISAASSEHTIVAYNGSVLENYPGFRNECQEQLDQLVQMSGGGGDGGKVELVYAAESSLVGAAVAVACLND
jgi:hexokinase